MNSYVEKTLAKIEKVSPNQPEFYQAVKEIYSSLSSLCDIDSSIEKYNLLEFLVEPERIIIFKVPWIDDNGRLHINRGYRVQFNSALGPYKGGLRFHPSVNLSIVKFLGFEQIFKNALTGTPIGGAKGGSNFNPKGKSNNEIMRFCQSFMGELWRHIGPDTDVPAGDIGVGSREIGYLFGYYKKLTNTHVGALTGRGIAYGGSLVRKEATGYGLVYILKEMLRIKSEKINNKRILISGSGNVAIYANEKATKLGGIVVAMSDSTGVIYDINGINADIIKLIKRKERGTIVNYINHVPNAVFINNPSSIWSLPADIALPCATQNEINLADAINLVDNGCIAIAEGANMPLTSEAIDYVQSKGIMFMPGKAANAGGVATSALEMAQSSQRIFWSFEKVDARLNSIMVNIFNNVRQASIECNQTDNYVLGANIAAFKRIKEAIIAQGSV